MMAAPLLDIHRIEKEDLGSLFVMALDFAIEMPVLHPVMDDEEILRQVIHVGNLIGDEKMVNLIAYEDAEPAGYLLAQVDEYPYGKPSKIGTVQEIYVIPSRRGSNIGFALMKEGFRIGLELGVGRFESCGFYGKTDERWSRVGFKPYLVCGFMEREDAEKFVNRGEKLNENL
jgi:GNAT superfamily N-acetyltransferase